MGGTLLFAFNRNQYQRWMTSPHFDSSVSVFTTDLWISQTLKLQGFRVLESDMRNDGNDSKAIAENWWKPYFGGIKHQGIELAKIMASDLIPLFSAARSYYHHLTKVLLQEKPDRLIVFTDFEKPFLQDGKEALLNAMALWLARENSIPTSELSTVALKETCEIPNAPTLVNPTKSRPSFQISTTKDILLARLSPNAMGRSLDFINELNKSPEFDFVIAKTEEHPIYDSFSGSLAINQFHDWLPRPSQLDEPLNLGWKKYLKSRFYYRGDYPYLFANPFFSFQLETFWKSLWQAAKEIDFSLLLFRGLRPSACLLEGSQGFDNCWKRTAELCSVRTIPVPSSETDPSLFLRGLKSKPSVFDLINRKHFLDEGNNSPETFRTVRKYFSEHHFTEARIKFHGKQWRSLMGHLFQAWQMRPHWTIYRSLRVVLYWVTNHGRTN